MSDASILPIGTVTFLVTDADPPAMFESEPDAVAATLEIRATSALHTGEGRVRDDGTYVGAAVRTAERLLEIANDGQTLLSAPTASAVAGLLPAGSSLVDLGLHRLRDLSSPMRVFELRSGGQTDSAPLLSLDRVPHNLPVHFTGFVGRQAELTALRTVLRGERLVTLTGVGGSGKTRLAAQAAADQAEQWPDGVWWVELGVLSSEQSATRASEQQGDRGTQAHETADVAEAVAAAIGVMVEPVRGPLESAAAQVRDRRLLICLDNCEHVLDGAAEVAAALLRSCPEVSVLTTSREPLGVPGETVWRVPPLAADDALALFVERAVAVRPWFTLDASSEAAVRTMCTRLDGIPLALELAAAWLRTLTPQQIEAGLDDRFALLVRSPRGAVRRQQTLAASIDWSYSLLDERDQIVLRRLAVFPGTFDLAAARSVTGTDPLDAVGRLVDKSLIVADEARYRLLETIRQFAADRLAEAGETTATRDRHLAHYLAVVEETEPESRRDMDAWRTRLEMDYDNLRAALDWGLAAPDPEPGRRLAAALPWLWHLHGHGLEGIDFLRRAVLRAPDDRSRLQARLLTGIALAADTAGPLDLEYDAAQRALTIATEEGDDLLRAWCLALSAVGQFYTDFDTAWALTADTLRVAEGAGDPLVVDAAHALQGMIMHLRDRHDAAEPLLRDAVDGLLRRHRGIAATTLSFQASGAMYTGDLAQARRLADQAVEVAEPLGDYLRFGSTRSVLALVHGLTGDVDAGLRVMRPVLRLVEGAENDVFVSGMARAMGTLLLGSGDADAAATWFGREARSTDRGAETYLAAQALPGLAAALRALGRADEAGNALDRADSVAAKLGMPRVIADALEQRAHLAAAAGDLDDAIDLHHKALAERVEHGLRTFYVDSLDALAALGARTERPAESVRLLAAGQQTRAAMGYPRPAHNTEDLRSALGERAFDEAWAEGARLTLDEAVAYVRRARGQRGRPSTGWGSLTPTELDVVRLVRGGLNNPEIAARLLMGRGTVKTHLSHIYGKLGVANRTELATLAVARLTETDDR